MIELVCKDRQTLTGFGKTLNVSCLVRNELNGQRGTDEVVYSCNADGSRGVPYMPRPFPPGTWAVEKAVQRFNVPDLGPWIFATTAWQMVDEWEVVNGVYTKPTGRQVKDFGYDIHISYRVVNGVLVPEITSDGCLHIEDSQDMTKEEALNWLVGQVNNFYAEGGFHGDSLQIQVTEPT